MARRIAMLACLSGLASTNGTNPYKGPEAKDRMLHTNLRQEFPEGAEWIEAYCEPGLDVMTCWDTYVLLHTGDQFGQCWDIPEDKAQCAWTIGISAIGDIPGQCGASVVERARYRCARARSSAAVASASERARSSSARRQSTTRRMSSRPASKSSRAPSARRCTSRTIAASVSRPRLREYQLEAARRRREGAAPC